MKDKYIDQYGLDSLPHLIIASEHRLDAFVTINESLLKDREELEKKFKIKIRTPDEMMDEEEEDEDPEEDPDNED